MQCERCWGLAHCSCPVYSSFASFLSLLPGYETHCSLRLFSRTKHFPFWLRLPTPTQGSRQLSQVLVLPEDSSSSAPRMLPFPTEPFPAVLLCLKTSYKLKFLLPLDKVRRSASSSKWYSRESQPGPQ